ncbi:hypothetical protein [Haloferula sp.]|uniref:hypothetical protein n=1 Tax=Haloferula sp. TaxID=2497595 RepID=UPI00329FC2A5
MSTTTDADHDKPRRRTVLLISLVLQVGLFLVLWSFTPLRKSTMSVDPEEVRKRAEEVEKRERQRLEEERERREKVAIKRDDAEKLRKKAEAKEARKVAKKVRQMRELKERVVKERDESLTRLKDRSLDDVNHPMMDELLQLAEAIVEASGHLEVRSSLSLAKSTRPACIDLRNATASYIEIGKWAETEALAKQARDIRLPLKEKLEEIIGEALGPDQERERYGLFVHDSRGLIKRIDEYLAQMEQFLTSTTELAELNDLSSIPPEEDGSDPETPESMTLDELLAEAATLEDSTAENFTEMRASEMAQVEGSSFDEAMSKISEAFEGGSPDGKEQSGEEASQKGGPELSTVGDLMNYRSAQAAKGQKVTAHWTKAMNMAQQASAIGSRHQSGRSSEAFSSKGQGGKGGRDSQGGAGSRGGDTGKSGRNRSGGDGTAFRTEAPSLNKRLRAKIPADTIKAKALPGRRFRKDSTRQGWLFIDTWYVIGPWENDGQLNYEKTHPPEVGIDLDAEYTNGKPIAPNSDKRHPLRWQFVQSDIMRITPPNEQARSTYYAYTEVYFEEAAEMLVAIATDDAARMWVNDKLVWEDQGQSAWNLDEGFRVIQFEQGFNKFLARIENSPTLCEFSVLLCPPDQVTE